MAFSIKNRIKNVVGYLAEKLRMIKNNFKQCKMCGEVLATQNFSICNKNSDRLQSYCKVCQHEYKYNNKDGWYKDNKEHIQDYQKNYREEKKGYYLYIVLDSNNKVLYVGATEDIKYRIEQQHLKGHSHIKELMLSDKWTYIKYLDITNLVNNREELLLLENSLIELYNTEYNNKKNIIRNRISHY